MAFKDLRAQYGSRMQELLPKFRSPTEPNRTQLAEAERRGAACKRLLEDGDLTRIFKMVEDTYLNLWRTSGAGETAERERAHIGVNLLDDLINTMKAEVAKGDAAAAQMEKIARQ